MGIACVLFISIYLLLKCCNIIIQRSTWRGWCGSLRNQLFNDMKKDIKQERNYELDLLHNESTWVDYAAPSSMGCYKKYIDNKIRTHPSNTVLLFALDSTFILKDTNRKVTKWVVIGETYFKIMRAKICMDRQLSIGRTSSLLCYIHTVNNIRVYVGFLLNASSNN